MQIIVRQEPNGKATMIIDNPEGQDFAYSGGNKATATAFRNHHPDAPWIMVAMHIIDSRNTLEDLGIACHDLVEQTDSR